MIKIVKRIIIEMINQSGIKKIVRLMLSSELAAVTVQVTLYIPKPGVSVHSSDNTNSASGMIDNLPALLGVS